MLLVVTSLGVNVCDFSINNNNLRFMQGHVEKLCFNSILRICSQNFNSLAIYQRCLALSCSRCDIA